MRSSLASCLLILCVLCGCAAQAQTGGKVRTYYIAADEVAWNYAPTGIDQMTGKQFDGIAKYYTKHTSHRIGTVYLKAVYREYTDATFKTLKPRPESEGFVIK